MVQQLTYRQQSREYLRQALLELQNGDVRQASEKGWGAASQMLKAVADERGLEYSSHQALRSAAYRLSREPGVREIRQMWPIANDLHTNFYEGGMDFMDVHEALEQIEALVDTLEVLLPVE